VHVVDRHDLRNLSHSFVTWTQRPTHVRRIL
jgi:hypothetical protein